MLEKIELISQSEAMHYLKIGRTTLWRLRKYNQIPFIRIRNKVLFRVIDLIEFLEKYPYD